MRCPISPYTEKYCQSSASSLWHLSSNYKKYIFDNDPQVRWGRRTAWKKKKTLTLHYSAHLFRSDIGQFKSWPLSPSWGPINCNAGQLLAAVAALSYGQITLLSKMHILHFRSADTHKKKTLPIRESVINSHQACFTLKTQSAQDMAMHQNTHTHSPTKWVIIPLQIGITYSWGYHKNTHTHTPTHGKWLLILLRKHLTFMQIKFKWTDTIAYFREYSQ